MHDETDSEDGEYGRWQCPSCGDVCDADDAFSDPVSEATGWAVCPSCGATDVE